MSPNYKTAPSSHPYVAEVTFDPVNWRDLQRHVLERDELKLLGVDQSEPDVWTANVGCASRAVKDLIEDWG